MQTLKRPEQQSFSKGFIIDEAGQANNFAIEPQVYVDSSVQSGWTEYSEKLNGRLAMIGFVALIATEVLTGNTLIGLFTNL